MFSPVHLQQKRLTNAMEFCWVRRGRTNSDNWQNEEIPLDAALERYRVTILDDAGQSLRSVELAEARFQYEDALRLDDLGSLETNFTLSVSQLSDTSMPGTAATLSITF